MSGGDLVLVRESAEDLFPADPVLGEVDLRWPGVSLSGCELAEGTVRPAGVVMLKVLGQHLPQMMLIDDQQPVEEFPAQGADDSLADRVCSGRLRRAGENPDAVRLEYGVEGAGELAGAIPDQKLDRSRALPRRSMHPAWNTGSKQPVTWPARSLIRNLIEAARCPRSIRKMRAACVVHAPSGFAVRPAR